MAFDDYDSTVAYASSIAAQVGARTMPPWQPASCCRDYEHDDALTAEEIARVQAWAEGGTPEGDPADYVAPTVTDSSTLPRVDVQTEMASAYTPSPTLGTTDDTRCFLLDWPETETKFVTGLSIEPGTPGQVHHALLLVAGPDVVAGFEATDALDSAEGWSCPGGLVFGYSGWIGGWSPGWGARELPEGTGQRVEPGSKLILTVHYSVPGGDPQPDTSKVDLMVEDEVESQLGAISIYNPDWLTGGLVIPAGDDDVMASWQQPAVLNTTVVGVNLHMHERGSRGSVGVVHADGTRECLLQIDEWDYDWQSDYILTDPVDVAWDDSLWVECHWDNSADNQRIVDGEPEEPKTMIWGESTEMCVGFVSTR